MSAYFHTLSLPFWLSLNASLFAVYHYIGTLCSSLVVYMFAQNSLYGRFVPNCFINGHH